MFKIIEAGSNFFKIKSNSVLGFTVGNTLVVRHSSVGNNGTHTISSVTGPTNGILTINVSSIITPSINDGSINLPITNASTITDSFKVNGNFTLFFTSLKYFKVFDSTGNDGLYRVNSSIFSAGKTEIFVNTNIPNTTTNDGDIVSANDYIINFSDPTYPTILVGEQSINTETSLFITGRGSLNYAESNIENVVHILENFSSPTPPLNPIKGQLWYDTSTSSKKLKVFTGTIFELVNLNDFVLKNGDTMNLNANLTFNGGEVLGLPNTPSVNSAATAKIYVDNQVSSVSTALTTHTNDNTVHITSSQNTFLDSLNLTGVNPVSATQVNYLGGVNPVNNFVQDQLNDKLSKSIGTLQSINSEILFYNNLSLDSAKNITMQGGGTIKGLPSIALNNNDATSKIYVDNLVFSSTSWRDPVADPNLIDVVSSVPGSPIADTTYIAYGGVYPQVWGSITVNSLDIVGRNIAGTDWFILDTLTTGKRFIIAGENGTIGANLSSVGFVNDDLLEYDVGIGVTPVTKLHTEGRGQGGTPGTEIPHGTTVLANDPDSNHLGHTFFYDSSNNAWIEISGPGSVNAGTHLSYSGNVLNVDFSDGDVYIPTNLGIGVSSPATKLHTYTTLVNYLTIQRNNTGIGLNNLYNNGGFFARTTGTSMLLQMVSGAFEVKTAPSVTIDTAPTLTTVLSIANNGNMIASVGSTAGNGITINGTSSPKLRVADTGSSVYLDCQVDGAATYVGSGSNHPLVLRTNNISRITIAANGNVGIGTSDIENWDSTLRAIQLSDKGSLYWEHTGSGIYIGDNIYRTSGINRYRSTGSASRLEVSGGTLTYATSPSGTIDNAISLTNQLIVTNIGDVGIGITPTNKLHVSGGRTRLVALAEPYALGVSRTDFTNAYYLGINASLAPDLIFSNNAGTERVRFNDNGYVGIGITPTYPLHISNSLETLVKLSRPTESDLLIGSGQFVGAIKSILLGSTDALMFGSNVGVSLGGDDVDLMINVDGNFGFSTTDIENWHSSFKALQLGTHNAIMYGTIATTMYFLNNLYNDGATWKTRATGEGLLLNFAGGALYIDTVPSTAIDTTVTPVNRFTLTNTGNVGLGTTPVTKLHTYSTAQNHLTIQRDNTGTNMEIGGIIFSSGAGNTDRAAILAHTPSSGNNGSLTFYTQPTAGSLTERLKITETGNLIASVGSTAGNGITINGTSSPKLRVADTGSSVYLDCQVDGTATYVGSGSNHPLVLRTNNISRITIAANGDVSIGNIISGTWNGTTISISKGGTGQTTQTEAFDALAPTTTKGDIIVHNGTDNIRVPVGTNNQVLVADNTQVSGVKWAAQTGSFDPTQHALGSASAPSIAFTGFSSTGIFSLGSNSISITTNASEKLRIDSVGKISTGGDSIEINALGTGNRYAYIDFHGDDTNVDYSARILKDNTGVNSDLIIVNRGTGNFYIESADAGSLVLKTSAIDRFKILPTGEIQTGIGFLELNALTTGARDSYIDFHNADAQDYGARLHKVASGGTDSDFFVANKGIGNLILRQEGSGQVFVQTNSLSRILVNNNNVSILNSNGILNVNGTTANPSYSFTSFASSGIYYNAGISISVVNQERFLISESPTSSFFRNHNSTDNNNIIDFQNSAGNSTMSLYNSSGATGNGAATAMRVRTNSGTGRSINAGGTINASGIDYAEYEIKSNLNIIHQKGDVIGFDINGKVTNIYNNSKTFGIKSTNPSMVGGDSWGDNITDPVILEQERLKVDRIAYSGKVPVNITGTFNIGDYIVPQSDINGNIEAIAISETTITFEQYRKSVGRIRTIGTDGRPIVAVIMH